MSFGRCRNVDFREPKFQNFQMSNIADSRQQYRFMHKCKSTLNTPSSIANQTASLALAMRFYRKIHYLTHEFRVKLHAKTDIARIANQVMNVSIVSFSSSFVANGCSHLRPSQRATFVYSFSFDRAKLLYQSA